MEVRTTRSALEAAIPTSPLMRGSPPDAANHFDRIAETASCALEVPYVCVYFADAERNSETCFGPGSGVLNSFCRSLTSEAGFDNGPIFGPNSSAVAGGDGAVQGSQMAIPIRVSERVSGIFCVFDPSTRRFSDREIALASDFAELAHSEMNRQIEFQSLRDSEERFRAVTESAQDVVAILDRNARFTYVSPSAHSIFGSQPTRLIGTSIYECVFGEDVPAFREALEAQMRNHVGDVRVPSSMVDPSAQGKQWEGEGILDIEFRSIIADGLRYLRLLGNNLFNRRGVDGYLVHIRDVTDRAAFDAEVVKSRDRAEEMSRLKSAFLTNMSHEIRTPLTTILGFAEILAEEVDDESREFVQLIQQGGERLLDTLMSILDLARLESSSFDIVEEQFDVSEKVNEICKLLAPLARQKGITLNLIRPDRPIPALLDVSATERIVSSLISNGIKFTNDGSVTVSLEADDDHVLIHVADTGIGISEDFMPFLFEDFKQESEGLSRMHEGSGLGLSITKRLVQLMKGDIMAESEKGRGTVFTVALPRHGGAGGVQSSKGAADTDPARMRVLVVEDNADTRTLVNHLLRKTYDVKCASDADEAIEFASALQYDVLLVDINLGKGKSGEDVLHAIKSLPGYEETPVIAVTAYAMPGDRERFFTEGFDDYVSKPFSKQRLLEALGGVLI